MPRVLILHATVGTGHKAAANALRKVFAQRQPGEVRVVDTLDLTPGVFRKAYAGSYLDITGKAPLAWGLFYKSTNDDANLSELTNALRKLMESVSLVDLETLIETFLPDIIVCTHFLPMEMLLRLKRRGKLPQPIYCVITDHSAHTFWVYTDIDGYFVGSEHVKRQLIARGVSRHLIHIHGIPIDPKIAQPRDKSEARQQLDLPADHAVITLFAGGVDSEHVRYVAHKLLHSGHQGMLVLAAGRNETLLRQIADMQPGPTMGLRTLGYIDYVDELVTASDLVITKAGGLIVSEVLARGVPLVVIDPILGHEEWNADYVVLYGAGIQLRMAESVPDAVIRLLEKPLWLEEMRKGAVDAGRPRAAQNIASSIMKEYERRMHA